MTSRKALIGSQPRTRHNDSIFEPAPLTDELKVTIVLRPEELKANSSLRKRVEHNSSTATPSTHALTDDEFAEFQSPSRLHFKTIRDFARKNGLSVLEESKSRHDVVLQGAVGRLNTAFGIELLLRHTGQDAAYTHHGEIHLPENVLDVVDAVLGLDTCPLHDDEFPKLDQSAAQRSLSRAAPQARGRVTVMREEARETPERVPINPLEIANYYNFPDHADGHGQRIAIIEFAGGYHQSDLDLFFKRLNMKSPTIRDVLVGPTSNNPLDHDTLSEFLTDPAKAIARHSSSTIRQFTSTLEVTLDLQIIAALAPGAEIDVYFASSDGLCYRRAIYAALGVADPSCKVVRASDGKDVKPASVISISWGNPEERFDTNRVKGLEAALLSAARRGTTVICSTGDRGSLGLSPGYPANGFANVTYPSTSQYVLACGGTRLRLGKDERLKDEVVWNELRGGVHKLASTGGYSGFFEQPGYQDTLGMLSPHHLKKPTWLSDAAAQNSLFCSRVVPDVSASASMDVGFLTIIGGHEIPSGGTSAAAPLWAALIARINQSLGFNVGWITPAIYRPEFARAFRPVVRGNNKVDPSVMYYEAGEGWNACTGLGSPDGFRLLEAIRSVTQPLPGDDGPSTPGRKKPGKKKPGKKKPGKKADSKKTGKRKPGQKKSSKPDSPGRKSPTTGRVKKKTARGIATRDGSASPASGPITGRPPRRPSHKSVKHVATRKPSAAPPDVSPDGQQ